MKDKIIVAYNKGYRCTRNGKPIGPNGNTIKGCHKNKYHFIKIRIPETKNCKNIAVHRLQAFQKYGYKMFESGIEVRHLNGNPSDNSWDNIAIGDHRTNMMDIPEHIRIAKALHATSFVKKYDEKEVKEFHSKEKSYKKTMEKFNITSKGTLHHILNR